ncbi:MAG: hypothetical protein WCL50_16060 [Spirochaetota bacterium]
MNLFNTILPFVSSTVSMAFAIVVLVRFLRSKGHSHLLLWTIGLLMYSLGGFCEGWNGAFGWNPAIFRLWYLFGAMLVAAWLGQGTVYLLAKPRTAHIAMALLLAASVYGAFKVLGADLDPARMNSGELSGHAIVSGGVRILTPFFNVYGTLTLVGGAAYSAWIFFRKKILPNRAIGNVLIAAGAMLPAFGGTFSRFGLASALYVSELCGAIVIFLGFLWAVRPAKAT